VRVLVLLSSVLAWVVAMTACTTSHRATTVPESPGFAEAGTVRGTVLGAPAGDVVVMALPVSLPRTPGRGIATTSEPDGSFVLRGLAPGAYDLIATAEGRTTASPVRVAPGAPGSTTVQVPLVDAAGAITVEVTATDQSALAGLRAIAWDPNGLPHLGHRVGATVLMPVGPGAHRVTVDARGYRPAELTAMAATAARPVTLVPRRRVLLISGDDDFHDWRSTSAVMREALETTGVYEVRVVEDVAILGSPDALAPYATILLNAQVRHSSPAMREGLTRYVEAGGGLVALHWTIASFPDWPAFRDLLGRAWDEQRSGEDGDHPFRITPNGTSPITSGLAPFETSADDMLHFDLVGEAPIEVLAEATSSRGHRFPAMWTRTTGAGRIFFASFGHSAAARMVPGVRETWIRAVGWTARELR
jgi:type 1 glutamine amidotransferase